MVKIKAKNEKMVHDMNLIVPIDGVITIDGNGEAEVSDACADVLVNCTNDWMRSEVISDEKRDNVINNDNNDKSEREILEERVKKSTVEELRNICKEMNFDEDEYGKLSKKNLQKYILDKYDALSNDEEVDEEEDDEEEGDENAEDTSDEEED